MLSPWKIIPHLFGTLIILSPYSLPYTSLKTSNLMSLAGWCRVVQGAERGHVRLGNEGTSGPTRGWLRKNAGNQLQPLNQPANIAQVVLPVLIQKWMKLPSGERCGELWQDWVLMESPRALQGQNPESLMTENITQENVLFYRVGPLLPSSLFRSWNYRPSGMKRRQDPVFSALTVKKPRARFCVSLMIRFHLHS